MAKYTTEFTVGTDKYNNEKLQSTLFNNIDVYAKRLHMTDEERKQFLQAVGYTLLGMRDGTISSIDLNGNLVDLRGLGNNMMGQVVHYMRDVLNNDASHALRYQDAEKKKYDRDADSAFKDYFNAGKDIDDDFIERWNKKDYRTKLQDAANFILTRINKINSGELDTEGVDTNTELANLNEALNAIRDGKISDNENSIFDKIGWSSAGVLLLDGKIVKKPSWETEMREKLKEDGYSDSEIEQQINNEKLSRRWDLEDAFADKQSAHEAKLNERLTKKHELNWQNFANNQYTGTYNKTWNLGKSSYNDNASYEAAIEQLGIDPSQYLKLWYNNPDGYTGKWSNKDLLKNFIPYMYRIDPSESHFIDNGNGTYILSDSINYNTGRALVYNSATGDLQEINPTKGSTLLEVLRSNWYKHNPVPNSDTNGKLYKEGGIIKLDSGGNIDYTVEDIKAAYLAGYITLDLAQQALLQLQSNLNPTNLDHSIKDSTGIYSTSEVAPVREFSFLGGNNKSNLDSFSLDSMKKRSLSNRAKSKGIDENYEKYLESNASDLGFSDADSIRLVNLANDLSSIVSSYIPVYGTAVAGGLGLLSLGLDTLADIKDKHVSKGLVMSNLLQNAGFAALGMIPGGAGKISKVWKGIKKLAPTILSASAAYSNLKNPEILESLSKLVKFDDASKLSKLDIKNIAEAVKTLAFAHNTGKAASLAFNGTLKNFKLAPSVLRNWGELSLGSKESRMLNEKMIQAGSLQSLTKGLKLQEVTGIKGKSLTIKGADGKSKSIVLKNDSYKALNDIVSKHTDKETALKAVNSQLNEWLTKNPESHFQTKLGDFEALKTEAKTEQLKDLVIDAGSKEKGALYGYLKGLTEGKKDTDLVSLKLNSSNGGNKTYDKLTVKQVNEIAKKLLDESKATVAEDGTVKWEGEGFDEKKGIDAANALFNSENYYLKNPLEPITTEAGIPYYLTDLTTGNITLPSKTLGISKAGKLSLETTDTTPGITSKTKNWLKTSGENSLYEGNTEAALLNRRKSLAMALLESLYRQAHPTLGSLGNYFNNNWEMLNSAGPFRFGIKGSATTNEIQNNNKTEFENTYGTNVSKWIDNKSKLTGSRFWDTPEGLEWINQVKFKQRNLTKEEAILLMNNSRSRDAVDSVLGANILNGRKIQLNKSFLTAIERDPELLGFKNMSPSDILDLIELYKSNPNITNLSEFISLLKLDLRNPLITDKTILGLKEFREKPVDINTPILLFQKDGGKLKAIQKLRSFGNGGNSSSVNNMNFSGNNNRKNWHTQVFDTYKNDIYNRIDTLTDNDLKNYVGWLNTMQDRHSNMYRKAGSDFTKKASYDDAVKQYQIDYDNNDQAGYNTGLYKNGILQAFRNGRYQAVGNTKRITGDGDLSKFKADGIYGAITDDRRILGRVSNDGTDDWDADSLNTINERLKKRGYKMYLDKNTNYYKIGYLPGYNKGNNPTTYGEASNLHPGKDTLNKAKELGLAGLRGIYDNLSSLEALRRAGSDINMIKKNAKIAHASNKAAYLPYLTGHKHVTDDMKLVLAATREGGHEISHAAHLGTSNASDYANNVLQGHRDAAALKLKAQASSDDYAHKTEEASTDYWNTINNKNWEIRGTNIERGVAKDKIDGDIDLTENKSIQDIKDTYSLAYIEKPLKENELYRKKANDSMALAEYEDTASGRTDATYTMMQDRLNNLKLKSLSKDLTEDEQKEYSTLLRNSQLRLNQLSINARNKLLRYYSNKGIPFRQKVTLQDNTESPYDYGNDAYRGQELTSYSYAKDGGTLKDIREARIKASISDTKEFNKMILHKNKINLLGLDTFSKGTLLAIKKALGL